MQDLDLPLHGALDPVASLYGFLPEFVARLLHQNGILLNRDSCRSPMQWSTQPNAGFAPKEAKPWIPIHSDYTSVNVEAELQDPHSILQCYRRLLRLRKNHVALNSGSLTLWAENTLPPQVLGYRRLHKDETIDVLLHFDDASRTIVLDDKPARVLGSTYVETNVVRDKRITLRPFEGVFLLR
jgi:alpha-glucosidase